MDRQLLIRARNVLNTLYHETADDLAKPERQTVIERLMTDITSRLHENAGGLTINVNGKDRVRLTDKGREILREQHENLYRALRDPGAPTWEYVPPTEDADGWSEWQLWDLMSRFGPYIHLGFDPPFETNIRIVL